MWSLGRYPDGFLSSLSLTALGCATLSVVGFAFRVPFSTAVQVWHAKDTGKPTESLVIF